MSDIRNLKLLVSLSRHKHFSRAAEDCGISFKAARIAVSTLQDIDFCECNARNRKACQGQVITISKYETYQDPTLYVVRKVDTDG